MRSEILKDPLPYLALFLCHVIWAVNTVVAKATMQEVPVMSLLFLRFLIGALLLSPFLINHIKKQNSFPKTHIKTVFFAGLFMIVINNALGYTGLTYTTAINASVLGLFLPLFSVIFGWWLLKEHLYKINLIGLLFGLTGGFVIIGMPIFSYQAFSQQMLGNILTVLGGIAVVIGFGLSKEMTRIYPPLFLTAVSFSIGAIAFFPAAILDYSKNPGWVASLTTNGILGILYVAVFATAIAYLLTVWALETTKLSQVSLFHYIEPGITAVIAIPFLGESISSAFLIGTIFVVLGVYWGTLGKQVHNHHHKAHHL